MQAKKFVACHLKKQFSVYLPPKIYKKQCFIFNAVVSRVHDVGRKKSEAQEV